MTLMATDDAIKLVEKEVYTNRYNFEFLDSFLAHCHDTGEIAREIAEKLSLNSEEAALAGYFHDIGGCFTKDKKCHTFHEIVGARYIESKGVELGIADSQEECDRIAQSLRSHFVVYEQFRMPEYNQWLPGLRDTNPKLLLPSSWNELVIIYAELVNINGKRISFEERIAEIKDRDKKTNNPRFKAVEIAETRLFGIKKDLENALQRGKIDTTKYTVV